MPGQNPSPEHQNLVSSMINYLSNNLGHQILEAAYESFAKPQAQGRHEPDIVSKDRFGLLYITEAKISNDLNSETTKEQFVDFASRTMISSGQQVPFYIIVYKRDEKILWDTIINLGLGNLIDNGIKIWTL